MSATIPDLLYRCPSDLAVTPMPVRRLMVIGQCLMAGWSDVLKQLVPGAECDYYMFNNAQQLPENLPHPAAEYDFQLVQIPLRSIVPDETYFRLSYGDTAAYETLFNESRARLNRFLASAMRWNKDHGLLTFVANFILPQQNPMGRLLPRYDLRNFVHFVERLNETLAKQLSRYSNAYFFDFDQIVSSHGRKYVQDDAVWPLNHNAALSDYDFEKDRDRLEAPIKASEVYALKTHGYVQLGWTELLTMYRTIRQIDMVKLVVVDVDDTLWRGVAAEQTEHSGEAIEGWPLGVAEALGHLKRRGILLAVVSKNDETIVTSIWERLFGNRLKLDDFAIRKINWRSKAENVEEILQETNLLPRSVVFIDDNPVERASIEAAFPDIRVLGSNPLVWRRILLWSAETQLPEITAESTARTEMVRAQLEREAQRKPLSQQEFLATLNLEVGLSEIDGVEHQNFPRALELINKSNQYNTTGQRWTKAECVGAFARKTRLFVFDARDRFTRYGIVGVVIVDEQRIVQFVMSCRVVGLDVEIAALAALAPIIREATGAEMITGDLKETALNLLARDLWQRCGFRYDNGAWVRPLLPALARPSHIRISVAVGASAVEISRPSPSL